MKKKYRLPIGELFNFLGMELFNLNKEVEITRHLKIKTLNGEYVDINHLVRKQGHVHTYDYDTGSIKCDENHVVKSNGEWKYIKDCDSIDTIHGNRKIVNTTYNEYRDVYDMALDDPHTYVTSDGVICHNTTIAKMLASSIECDSLYINASDESRIDDIRDKVKTFAGNLGFHRLKVLILDEADRMNIHAQMALRNIMETYAGQTRFILTCNYHEKLIEPLVSRCQVFHIQPPSKSDVAKHVAGILDKENVTYEVSDFKALMKYYPDIRRIIQNAQQHSVSGKLSISEKQVIESDAKFKLIEILKAGSDKKTKLKDCRQFLADNDIGDFQEYADYLYEKLDDYAPNAKATTIKALHSWQVDDVVSANKELNFASCILSILEGL